MLLLSHFSARGRVQAKGGQSVTQRRESGIELKQLLAVVPQRIGNLFR